LADQRAQSLHPANLHRSVATLRAAVGADVDDPRLTELVGELSLKSPEFRRLWARHDVRAKTSGRKRHRNPLVGDLELSFDALEVAGSAGQILIVYSADPDSADEQALNLCAITARASAHADHATSPSQ
jgi:transcription regulator MmyB-like protein